MKLENIILKKYERVGEDIAKQIIDFKYQLELYQRTQLICQQINSGICRVEILIDNFQQIAFTNTNSTFAQTMTAASKTPMYGRLDKDLEYRYNLRIFEWREEEEKNPTYDSLLVFDFTVFDTFDDYSLPYATKKILKLLNLPVKAMINGISIFKFNQTIINEIGELTDF